MGDRGLLLILHLLRAWVEVAGLALLGQGAVGLLAGRNKEHNPIYALFSWVARPMCVPVEKIFAPRFTPGSCARITFILLFLLWIGLAAAILALAS